MKKLATSSLLAAIASGSTLVSGLTLADPAAAAQVDGLIVAKSPHSATETVTRFEAQAKQRGLKISRWSTMPPAPPRST